jgi:hypothetical protein
MVLTVPKLPPVEERLKQLQPILCQLIDESGRLQLKFNEVVAALKRETDKLYQAARERDSDLAAQLKAIEAKAHQHRLAKFADGTPADLWTLGYVCLPCLSAPNELLECLNDDERDGESSIRICRNYCDCETLLLAGG